MLDNLFNLAKDVEDIIEAICSRIKCFSLVGRVYLSCPVVITRDGLKRYVIEYDEMGRMPSTAISLLMCKLVDAKKHVDNAVVPDRVVNDIDNITSILSKAASAVDRDDLSISFDIARPVYVVPSKIGKLSYNARNGTVGISQATGFSTHEEVFMKVIDDVANRYATIIAGKKGIYTTVYSYIDVKLTRELLLKLAKFMVAIRPMFDELLAKLEENPQLVLRYDLM